MIDDFIIPANLKVGDKVYDENLGNRIITSSKTQEYAGASRMVLYPTAGNNTFI